MRQNQNFQVYSIFISVVVYLCIILVFVFSFTNFLNLLKKTEQKVITEGLLLPRTDFPVNTTFDVDPLLTSSNVDSIRDIRKAVSSLIFSTLFKENSDGTLSKDLVENYDFSNSQDLTIVLRKDAKWQDGEEVNAEDVEFTFNIMKGVGQSSFYAGAINGNDLQIQVIDEFTIKISLTSSDGPRPNASYVHELIFPILPKHILENYPKPSLSLLSETEFGKNPIGSGILKYTDNRIEELVLTRNDDYYSDKVQFDNYIFRFYKDFDDLIKDFKLKNVDLIRRSEIGVKDEVYNNLTNDGFVYDDRVLKDRRLVLYFNLGNRSADSSPFNKSTLLRRSLLSIINRPRLTQYIDISREVYGPIDQDSFAFLPEVVQKQAVNPDDFKKIVTGLGYSLVDGIYTKDSIQLKFVVTYLSGGIRQPIIDELKKQLAEVGVILVANAISASSDNIEQGSGESFLTIVNNREYDALLSAVDHIMDPDVYNEWHSSKISAPGLNLSGFSSKVADRTLEDGRVKVGDDRKADYTRFQRTFFEEVPAIYLVNPGMQIFLSPRLKIFGDKQLADEVYFYKNIDKWSVESKFKDS